MGRSFDQKQFFILRTGSFSECIFRHIQSIRFCTGNHQQWLFDR